jgi:hypothetical protein
MVISFGTKEKAGGKIWIVLVIRAVFVGTGVEDMVAGG